MARIRTIEPEFFTSDDICVLSPLARWLHVGLWCESDREGRLVWTPNVLKRRYLPNDACDIEAVAGELIARGLVVLYSEDLADIPTFSRHQHVNAREAQSNLPAPPSEASEQLPASCCVGRERNAKEGEGTSAERAGKGARPLSEDSRPGEADLDWAASQRPDLGRAAIDDETERFRHHTRANRRTAHDWGAAWRLWIGRAHGPDERRGGYRKPTVAPDPLSSDGVSETQWRARLSKYRPGRFWLEGDWGPRPESGQSRVPPELLAEWRQRTAGAKLAEEAA
jgi:hypothetical protein